MLGREVQCGDVVVVGIAQQTVQRVTRERDEQGRSDGYAYVRTRAGLTRFADDERVHGYRPAPLVDQLGEQPAHLRRAVPAASRGLGR